MNLLEEGAKVWPTIAARVTPAQLSTFLARRTPSDPPPAADLLLVCACLLGHPEALSALDKSILSQIPGWVTRIDPSPDFGHDVAQAVRELLLTGDAPKLETYAGKGSLEGWIRVTAVRLALRLKQRPTPNPHESSASQTEALDTGLAKAEARARVEQALQGVLASLDPEERAWLKLYYLDGLSLEKVASLFAVHTSTISRRLAALEGQVLASLREKLELQLRLPPAEVESLIRFVRSQLEVSLGRALGKTTD